MDRAEDKKSGETSLLKESHFTPKPLELFEHQYENGYNLYAEVHYVDRESS